MHTKTMGKPPWVKTIYRKKCKELCYTIVKKCILSRILSSKSTNQKSFLHTYCLKYVFLTNKYQDECCVSVKCKNSYHEFQIKFNSYML